jgi:ferredoxin
MFANELARLAADSPWLAMEVQHTRGGGARLDAFTLEARCPDWRDREAFVCGPESLLDMVTSQWDAHGLLDQLHLERFTPTRRAEARTEAASDGATARVTFDASGSDAVSNDDTTLLELAESAGLAPAYGCRMGVCHTCTTPLLAGCARDLRNGRLSEAGTHVQLCVSAPAGDLTLDL